MGTNDTSLGGLITRLQAGFYTVETEDGTLTCRLRGKLKRGPREGDLVAVGDRVKVTKLDEDEGMIESIEPREHMFTRMAPTSRGEYQQIIIANPDQAVFVFSCAEPPPNMRMLDRFLVVAEKEAVPALIVANKVDLTGMQTAKEQFERYPDVGYEVIYSSAVTGRGVERLKERLRGKISVLTGPSGSGKTSLLNAIQPGLGLTVKEVSQATQKGRHTTVVRELFPLDEGGYVADTPGLKALALWDIEPEEVDAYFPELRPLVAECQFSDCTHLHEPGCEVMAAVEEGRVHPERYDSYARIRIGEEEASEWW